MLLLGTAAPASNLRGQPYQRYDGAGVVTNVSFDFKGNPRESKRRVALAYAATVDWIALDALTDPTAIASAASSALETETFSTTTAYDAREKVDVRDAPVTAALKTPTAPPAP